MQTSRLLFVDNLRTLMIVPVVVLHLSVTYGGEGSWFYEEGRADMTLYPLVKFILAVVAGVPLCFIAAALIRRLPLASRIL